jgi:hypothetical protein
MRRRVGRLDNDHNRICLVTGEVELIRLLLDSWLERERWQLLAC